MEPSLNELESIDRVKTLWRLSIQRLHSVVERVLGRYGKSHPAIFLRGPPSAARQRIVRCRFILHPPFGRIQHEVAASLQALFQPPQIKKASFRWLFYLWCPKEDLNLHGLAATGF